MLSKIRNGFLEQINVILKGAYRQITSSTKQRANLAAFVVMVYRQPSFLFWGTAADRTSSVLFFEHAKIVVWFKSILNFISIPRPIMNTGVFVVSVLCQYFLSIFLVKLSLKSAHLIFIDPSKLAPSFIHLVMVFSHMVSYMVNYFGAVFLIVSLVVLAGVCNSFCPMALSILSVFFWMSLPPSSLRFSSLFTPLLFSRNHVSPSLGWLPFSHFLGYLIAPFSIICSQVKLYGSIDFAIHGSEIHAGAFLKRFMQMVRDTKISCFHNYILAPNWYYIKRLTHAT